jgi:hypothetical protein
MLQCDEEDSRLKVVAAPKVIVELKEERGLEL